MTESSKLPRRFTEQELREVIGRAVELEGETRLWSEEEVLEIAREAGIDGDAALTALREREAGAVAGRRGALGIEVYWSARRQAQVLVSAPDFESLADGLRAARAIPGRASVGRDTLEWRDAEGIQATVARTETGVGVTVTASRNALAQSSASLFGVFGGLLGAYTLKMLGFQEEQIIPGLLAGVGVGLGAWRLYWRRVSAGMRVKVSEIADLIVGRLRPPSGSGGRRRRGAPSNTR